MKTVVIIEDDYVLEHILKDAINQINGFQCLFVFNNPVEFLKSNVVFDIILLDIVMHEMNGIDAIEVILAKYPQASIIMNTIKEDDDTIISALTKGAIGYLDKQTVGINLSDVLSSVASGGGYMTPCIARKVINKFNQHKKINFEVLSSREREIAESILDGLSYKMIALRYNIAIDTVRMHIKSIYKKLQINSKGRP